MLFAMTRHPFLKMSFAGKEKLKGIFWGTVAGAAYPYGKRTLHTIGLGFGVLRFYFLAFPIFSRKHVIFLLPVIAAYSLTKTFYLLLLISKI